MNLISQMSCMKHYVSVFYLLDLYMVYCISEIETQGNFCTQVLTERLICKFVYSKESFIHYARDLLFLKYFVVD